MKRTIYLFMWGYQQHFRSSVERVAENVLRAIGVDVKPRALLVGVRRPGVEQAHPVCVEPEDGAWPLSMFEGLDADVEAAIPNHEMQTLFFGDAPSMRDKPENIRRMVIAEQVEARLQAYDRDNGLKSFLAGVYPVGDHDVATVLQVPAAALAEHPTFVGEGFRDQPLEVNFVDACLRHVLGEARDELIRPEPGRNVGMDMRPADELIRAAAADYLRRVSMLVDGRGGPADLFQQLNQLSVLMYEGRSGVGRMLLVDPESEAVEFVLRLDSPVRLSEARWSRKLLQMASTDVALIASPHAIHGLGRLRDGADLPRENCFTIDLLDHYQWDLRNGDDLLLRTRFGEARLPQEPLSLERFADNAARLLDVGPTEATRLWDVFRLMTRQPNGSMVVVAADAEAEAMRLAHQGTRIAPTPVTDTLLQRASRIDGTILLDPSGTCHAVGVILDGPASDACTPSRGARYNSAVRYVEGADARRMAIVVSDDRTVDIVPLLRPRLARAAIEAALDAFETATPETYHASRSFLDNHRFYLSAAQCERANRALKRLEAMPRDGIWIMTQPWQPDPGMNEGYLN